MPSRFKVRGLGGQASPTKPGSDQATSVGEINTKLMLGAKAPPLCGPGSQQEDNRTKAARHLAARQARRITEVWPK